MYEDVCYDIPNTANPDSTKRWILSGDDMPGAFSHLAKASPPGGRNDGYPKICNEEGECYHVLDAENNIEFLELRSLVIDAIGSSALDTRARKPKICLPKGKSSNFVAKNYPGAANLGTRGISFRSLANAASCLGSTIASGARLLYVNYVAEHVMELQTPALYANSMIKGILQSGADAPGKAEGYDWTQMFAANTGYIFQSWQSLGVSAPNGLPGTSPADTIMTALGSKDDVQNMLILDRATNGLKAAVGFNDLVVDEYEY